MSISKKFGSCEKCHAQADVNVGVCPSCGAKFDGLLYDADKEYDKDYLIKNPPKYVTKDQMPAYTKAVSKATHDGQKKVKFIVVATLFKKYKEEK